MKAASAMPPAADLAPDLQSLEKLEAAASRAGDSATAARTAEAIKKQKESAPNPPWMLPAIPEKDRTYFVFVLTLGLIGTVLAAGWTVWAAIHPFLQKSKESSATVVDRP